MTLPSERAKERRVFRNFQSLRRGLISATMVAAGLVALPPGALAATAGPSIADWPMCLAGRYDGGQSEVAARLTLDAGGRFVYEMSYGALDEMAEGRWDTDGKDAVLTSDPVNPPRYALLSETPLSEHELRVSLALPRGISAQFFEALIGFSDGARMIRQLSDEGLVVPLEPGRQVQSVAIMLPVYDLQSDPFLVSGGSAGRDVRIRFDPNELGKVAFARERLAREGADLLIERHGRSLRFRPEGRGCLGR